MAPYGFVPSSTYEPMNTDGTACELSALPDELEMPREPPYSEDESLKSYNLTPRSHQLVHQSLHPKSYWVRASLMATITFVVGIAIGVYAAKTPVSEDPSSPVRTTDGINEAVQDKFALAPVDQQTIAPAQKQALVPVQQQTIVPAHQQSTWVARAPLGPVHMHKQTMSVVEFLHQPGFINKLTDQITRLHYGFKHGDLGQTSQIYKNPQEEEEHHAAARETVEEFIANLAKTKPKMAMFLNSMHLDKTQQQAMHNVLDLFTDPRTIDLGVDAVVATAKGLPEGKEGIKRRLQAKLGKGLEPLRQLREAVFPQDFDMDEKNDLERRAIEEDDHDASDGHFDILKDEVSKVDLQSLKDLKDRFGEHQLVATTPKSRRLMKTMAIVNIVKASITTVLLKLLAWMIPGKVAKYIAYGIGDVATIVVCVQWGTGANKWIPCVIHIVGSLLATLQLFVPALHKK